MCIQSKGLFTWRWGTPGGWGNPPSRGRKIKRFYMQSYNPGVLGWGFLRLLLRLQLRSFSIGVPSSHLEKDERLILGHICIYSWKRHALCYAVLGYARNRWPNTLYGIVWETKYGRFTTLNIPKCEHFTLLSCLSIAASGDFCHETARKCTKFQNIHVSLLSFLPRTRPRLGGLPHLDTFKLSPRLTGLPYLADRETRLGGSPHLSCKLDQDEIRNYMDRRVTSPTWGPPPPCKRALNCGNWNLGTLFIRFSLIFHEKMPYTCEIRQVWRAEKGSWKYVKTSRLLFNYFLEPK